MPRPSKFDEDQLLTAAGRLIAAHGPSGATIGAIGRAVGARTGSIYHRFASRDVLLGEVWLRAAAEFQNAFFEQLNGTPPRAAGVASALYMVRRVRERPDEARLLLLHRREDFIGRGWPPRLPRPAGELRRPGATQLRAVGPSLCAPGGTRDPRAPATPGRQAAT